LTQVKGGAAVTGILGFALVETPMPRPYVRSPSRWTLAALASLPWLALCGLSLLAAEAHSRAILPFGRASLCGAQPHCGWCYVAAACAVLAAVTAAWIVTAPTRATVPIKK
jgi:uncharacterized membrane protein